MALARLSASQLAADSSGTVVERLTEQMLRTHQRRVSESEQRSWAASLPALARDLADAGLGKVEVLLEHQLPLTSKRIDALLAGVHPKTGDPSYVIVELKQWSAADHYEGDLERVRVDAYGNRGVLHPLAQASGYRDYMIDFIPALAQTPHRMSAVAYLHNATEHSIIDLRRLPEPEHTALFTGERRGEFHAFLRSRLSVDEAGAAAADELISLRIGPSRQLLAVAAEEIQNREMFVLLDEQRTAYRAVLHAVDRARTSNRKKVVVISGGPGSGKSVIALSLMGEYARQEREVLHATGSRSFTQTMRKYAGRGSTRHQAMFKYFNQFMAAVPNDLELLICDEAHRIRETSVDRYTPKALRKGRPQVEELIAAARVPVFLLDENQVVRPGEMGSLTEITRHAEAIGIEVEHISLDAQFRCGGSESYAVWVQRLLGLVEGGPQQWSGDDNFELKVARSPAELTAALSMQLDAERSARMTAGFCWPWSDPRADGSLVEDVVIGDWSRPWNLKGDRAIGGAPPSATWATDPAGFGQVGCIYTAQGFEYDWNGVIFGPDLVRRGGRWVAQRKESRDPDFRSTKKVSDHEFDALIRNVYKVLLTRGMMGTILYSTDEETNQFFIELVEH